MCTILFQSYVLHSESKGEILINLVIFEHHLQLQFKLWELGISLLSANPKIRAWLLFRGVSTTKLTSHTFDCHWVLFS